jgi:UDP-glucose 4-epimerase
MSTKVGETFFGKNVLITGGLGFIGSNMAHRLTEIGANITLVDSLIPEYGGNLFNIKGISDIVTVNISDVRDEHGLAYLVTNKHFIFNLAGQTSHLDSMKDPYTDLDINCRSQLSILEACRKHNPSVRIVYASTRQIYGKPDYLPVDENHKLHPTDVNGINKMSGEWYHILYNNVYGIKTSALRLTNTYGPRMRIKDARQTFLGWWLRALNEGSMIEIFGDGRQLRDFNFVGDVVEAFLLSAITDDAVGQVINLGSSEVISLRQLAELLIGINMSGSYRIVPFPAERKAIDIGDYYSDYSKAKMLLKWEPLMSLKDGLATTIDFYKKHLGQYI